jgi:hypothetical protein
MVRTLVILLLGLSMLVVASAQVEQPLERWPAASNVDLATVKPADFNDDELDLPYYLAHFHLLANSVVELGEHRGFFDLSVWRAQQDNKPYNARIMENILSLSFFYVTKRPWNQYYGTTAVRLRLEAALDYWCRLQNPDGRFSEYGPQQWNLAATAFATKFMGESLALLKNGPPVDPALLDRVIKADRKAIKIVLTDPALYQHGKDFSNQFTNVWAGGLAFLKLYPDAELEALLRRRISEDTNIFQSPVGYFYEARGPDWGYNLGTHHSNLWMSWHYASDSDLRKILVAEETKFVDWLALNAVREPDGSGFTLNRGIETRQKKPFLEIRGSLDGQGQRLLAAEVPLARAFFPTQEEAARERMQHRAELEKNWQITRKLPVGEFSAFSPYAFLHRAHGQWLPTEAQRVAAIKLLPYLARQQFTEQRIDPRERLVFTFARRPGYYAVFNSGPHLTSQQRYGLGLIWHPEMGSLLQSQTGTTNAAWGTLLGQSQSVFEADTLNAEFNTNGTITTVQPGNHELPGGTFTIRYNFPDQGEKLLTFGERQVTIEVRHSGDLREQIPLLVGSSDKLELKPGEILLTRNGGVLTIHFDAAAQAKAIETGMQVGPRRVVTITLKAQDSLTYRFDFAKKSAQ